MLLAQDLIRARGCVPEEGADEVEGADDVDSAPTIYRRRDVNMVCHLSSLSLSLARVYLCAHAHALVHTPAQHNVRSGSSAHDDCARSLRLVHLCSHACRLRHRKESHTQRIPHAEHASPHAAHAHTLYHLGILLERSGGCTQPTWHTRSSAVSSARTPSKKARALTHLRAQSWRRVRPLPRHKPPMGVAPAAC